MNSLTTASRDLSANRVDAVYGAVSAGWRLLIDKDPDFAAAFIGYVESTYAAPHLEPKTRELLLLAQDACMTTLDADGAERRIGRALDLGASEREVLDVLELVCMLSIHSIITGLPLVGVLAQERPKELAGGYWDSFEASFPGFHSMLAQAYPVLYDQYRELGKVAWRPDGLAPKWRELVFVVADLSSNHLFSDGAAVHIANARHYGATPQEVIDAVGLTLPPAARSIDVCFPALEKALAQRSGAE